MQPCLKTPVTHEFNSALAQPLAVVEPEADAQPIVASSLPSSVLKTSRLVRALQTTLDVDSLLLIFFNEVAKDFSLQGVCLSPESENAVFSCGDMVGTHYHFRLKTPEETVGVCSVCFQHATLTTIEYCTLKALLTVLIYPLRNALRYRAVMQLALTDGLTGAGNRIHMENMLRSEIDASYRYGDFVSVLMIDIDHFKHINDLHGHAAGDAVLKSVAVELKSALRCTDMLFRYGGEEFLVLLGKTSLEGAANTAERLRKVVEALDITFAQDCFSVTVSVGGASLQYDEMLQDLLLRADGALYQAKQAGRNRVAMAE